MSTRANLMERPIAAVKLQSNTAAKHADGVTQYRDLNALARMAFGSLAGAVATYVMDIAGNMMYTEHMRRRERKVQEKSATEILAARLLALLELNPTEKDINKAASYIHWSFGITNGALCGLFAAGRVTNRSMVALAVAAWMFVFDEFGLALMKAAPPSHRYPWQTNFRSFTAHVAYGAALALAYEALVTVSRQKSTLAPVAK